jgi:hypothetical protein
MFNPTQRLHDDVESVTVVGKLSIVKLTTDR